MIKRLQLLVCVLTAVASLACTTAGSDVRCNDCNVILVSIDTLRADHLGCYGYGAPTTPSIDGFRKDAVLFSTAIAHAPSTEPSHASMFTSLIPHHHGAWRAKRLPISPAVPTLPEILSAAGFRTASFNGGGQVDASLGFGRGFEVYESAPAGKDRFADRVVSAITWIKAHPGERFFVFLHTYEVHAPYAPARRHLELFDADYGGALPAQIDTTLLLDIKDGRRQIDEADLRHIVAAYDAEVRSMDDAFGMLVAFLRKTELYDRTLIVLTSDHGEEFGEHGGVGQHSHTLYDELLRVPLLVKFPASRFGSGTVDAQVGGIDLLPTILDVNGVGVDLPFQGRSLLPLAEGQQLDEVAVLSQLDTAADPTVTSLRTRQRKLILGPNEFFRLDRDAGEQDNAYADPTGAAEVATMRAQVDEWLGSLPPAEQGQQIELDPETQRKLEALGYVD